MVLLLAGLLSRLPGHPLQVHTEPLWQLEGWEGWEGTEEGGEHNGPTYTGLLGKFV